MKEILSIIVVLMAGVEITTALLTKADTSLNLLSIVTGIATFLVIKFLVKELLTNIKNKKK